MSGPISQNIIKPYNCSFITPLPLYEKEFTADMDCGRVNFISRFNGWARYNYEVGLLMRHVIAEMNGAGITVYTRTTLQDLANLLEGDAPEAVMLLAHWNETGIELFDGIADAQWVLSHLPVEQKKIIDLAVCHPEPIMQAIKNCRSNTIVHGTTRQISATPAIWLRYFSLVIYTLKNSDSTYINASEMAFKGLLNLLP